MTVYWNNKNFIQILKEKVSKINFNHYEDASKEIRESVKAIEVEKIDSGEEMNDDDDDVVLLYFFYCNFIINVCSRYCNFHVFCFSLFQC